MQGSPRIDELRQKFHENPRRYFAPLANEYRKAGDPEQAIAICRAHLAQQPGHMSGHVVYGQALYDAKRPEEARSVFEKALSLDPDNAIVLRSLGDIARVKGESAEARHWYGKALDIDPLDSEVAAYIAELTEPLTGEPDQPVAAEADAVEPSESTPLEAAEPAGEEPAVLEAAEIEAEEGVIAATPADDQGDGFEEPVEPESEAADTPAAIESGPSAPDVAWRTTPQAEKSPFVTRTMAELYASQGYPDSALDIYRQLAIQHPDDSDLRDRIEELSADPAVEEPFSFSERSDDVIYQPTAEDLGLVGDTPPTSEGVHFTEMALGESAGAEAGFGERLNIDEDRWDPSLADFSELSLEDPVVPAEEPDSPQDIESTTTPESETLAEQAVEDSHLETESSAIDLNEVRSEPVAMPPAEEASVSEADAVMPPPEPVSDARFVDLPVALGEVQTSIDEAGIDAGAALVEGAEDAKPVVEGDENSVGEQSEVVAYWPELPAAEDLPHYTPKSPTIREFFATLGAMRAPDRNAGESFTARAAIPEASAVLPPDDLPLATEAFDSLFPDDPPASEEDTRAAFALSGALSGATHNPVPASLRTSPPVPSPAVPDASQQAQESEEDLRRFREWLDGLADS